MCVHMQIYFIYLHECSSFAHKHLAIDRQGRRKKACKPKGGKENNEGLVGSNFFVWLFWCWQGMAMPLTGFDPHYNPTANTCHEEDRIRSPRVPVSRRLTAFFQPLLRRGNRDLFHSSPSPATWLPASLNVYLSLLVTMLKRKK